MTYLLGSCTGNAGSSGDKPGASASDLVLHSTPPVIADVSTDQNEGGMEPPPSPGLRRLVDMAISDLAMHLDVDPSEIETVAAESVTWRDSGLGCPEPGHESMQVLTKGARIQLRWDSQVFLYHSGGNRPPFLCKQPDPNEPLPGGSGET
jgi:hypothetical protein